jgi:hypothetical protein
MRKITKIILIRVNSPADNLREEAAENGIKRR